MYFILIETIFSVILQMGTSPKLIIDKFNHLNLLTCFYFSCKYVYFLFIKILKSIHLGWWCTEHT